MIQMLLKTSSILGGSHLRIGMKIIQNQIGVEITIKEETDTIPIETDRFNKMKGNKDLGGLIIETKKDEISIVLAKIREKTLLKI